MEFTGPVIICCLVGTIKASEVFIEYAILLNLILTTCRTRQKAF